MDQMNVGLYVDDRPADQVFRVHPAVYSDQQERQLLKQRQKRRSADPLQ